jgi:plastocyanin
MWVASASHPNHTVYPEFDEKTSVKKGSSYLFTFDKVGSWGYHNHTRASDFGKVIVK